MENGLSFIFVIYNDAHLLKYSFPTIVEQTIKKKEIIIVDNNPTEESAKIVEGLLSSVNCCKVNYYPLKENLGYSGGANTGIKKAKYQNVAILNADIILTKNYSEKIIDSIYQEDKIAGATGKILKYDFKLNTSTKVIDTTGISLARNLKAFDRGQGEKDLGQYDNIIEVFGICGAIAIYKKKALDHASIGMEYFDEDFLAYKEDVDLSWRLNRFTYKFIYVPNAVAYHGRALGKINSGTLIGTVKRRKSQPAFLRELSLANQRAMIIKNMDFKFLMGNFPYIMSRVFLEFIFSIVIEPIVYIKSWKRSFKYLSKMLKKRRKLNKKLGLRL
ncbi:glycosyltransferase family 2 protein [[Brevibacterium] frigoritolerans]|nr:glycosyltransferase family 2 protein [Peribacillus frigoritolerans]